MGRRHLKDVRTDQLLPKIRGVCLHLHNNLDDPKTSLAITKAALPAFEGSPEHQGLIQADIQTLEELAASRHAFKIVEPLIALVTKVNDKHRELCTSIRRRNFRQDGSGLAGNLYRLFSKAEQDLAGEPARALHRMTALPAVRGIFQAQLVLRPNRSGNGAGYRRADRDVDGRREWKEGSWGASAAAHRRAPLGDYRNLGRPFRAKV
jgi:hypothetical protein